ncbi:putative N-acetyltransferase [Trachipleistophora hominis]|uniref:Putative N-acetyltransferase n=1 Tax=Trachipleistophora hominis TaxID=72359 RepID=L7K0B5_TRAHO|nr:putative N-acetyltransferase [Trachipleistophora hominis]
MTLGVIHGYQSQGFGSQMLSFVENMARSERIEWIYLHVQLRNVVASRFYLKWNYRVVKIEKDYYKKLDGQSAIVLCKYL